MNTATTNTVTIPTTTGQIRVSSAVRDCAPPVLLLTAPSTPVPAPIAHVIAAPKFVAVPKKAQLKKYGNPAKEAATPLSAAGTSPIPIRYSTVLGARRKKAMRRVSNASPILAAAAFIIPVFIGLGVPAAIVLNDTGVGVASTAASSLYETEVDSAAQVVKAVTYDGAGDAGVQEGNVAVNASGFAREEIAVIAPLSGEALLAHLQTIADAEAPLAFHWSANPTHAETWNAAKTDQTFWPFKDLGANVPVSSPFAMRGETFHGGTDMVPGNGTDITPIALGVVSHIDRNNVGGGGTVVIVDHNINGRFYQSWYGHMQADDAVKVRVGQVVDENTVLGKVGNTGKSTGPHLHLEIKNSSYTSINPVPFLRDGTELEEPYIPVKKPDQIGPATPAPAAPSQAPAPAVTQAPRQSVPATPSPTPAAPSQTPTPAPVAPTSPPATPSPAPVPSPAPSRSPAPVPLPVPSPIPTPGVDLP